MTALIDQDIGAHTLREINKNLEFWEQFEYDNWHVINFTNKTKCRFGWLQKGQYTKYVTLAAHQARFLSGVAPDVIQLLIEIE